MTESRWLQCNPMNDVAVWPSYWVILGEDLYQGVLSGAKDLLVPDPSLLGS